MSPFRPASSHLNLPALQRFTQRLADQFNADERLWERLAPLRQLRRLLRLGHDSETQKQQDLADFARAQPPKDVVAIWNAEP